MVTPSSPSPDPMLLAIGGRVRRLRRERGMTLRQLSELADLSVRFLAQVESGTGNIAVTRLARLAEALQIRLDALVADLSGPPVRPVLVLLGLRGAGKSSLGSRLASDAGVPFQEHDRLVEEEAGMDLQELFAIHGDSYYRRLARETLAAFLDGVDGRVVLAASGGLVDDPACLDLVRLRGRSVWLQATPEDHWDRVVAQGDRRPMRDRPEAKAELRRLLERREPLYGFADHRVDTSSLDFEEALSDLKKLWGSDLGK